jgi:hypothetical protein
VLGVGTENFIIACDLVTKAYEHHKNHANRAVGRCKKMRMLLFMLPFVLLTACERDDPVKRCQREFGTQGQSVVDKCVRWAVAPPSGNPEKDQPRD